MKHHRGGANVKNTDNLGRTPLHYAIKESLMLLVATGADIHPRDNAGKTPIHTAILAEDYFPYDLLEFLLTQKAKINIRDNQGQTTLKLAASVMRSSNDTVVKTFLCNLNF